MIRQQSISTYISGLVVSLILLTLPSGASAQSRKKVQQLLPDTTAIFNGFAVSVDLLGPGMILLGDYGTYEGALRLNLKDRYFPIVELGIGKADYEDEMMNNHYKTKAPFFRIGADFNLMKNKHDVYRRSIWFYQLQVRPFSSGHQGSRMGQYGRIQRPRHQM